MHTLLLAAITADGFIARTTNELADWTSKDDKRFFVAETKKHGVMIMGKTTFATIGHALPDRLIIVLSKDGGVDEIPGSVEVMQGEPRSVLDALEARGFSSVVLAGGASVYRQFLRAGVVDEIALTVEPILFGTGISLLDTAGDVPLMLTSCEKLGDEGSVLLRYVVKR